MSLHKILSAIPIPKGDTPLVNRQQPPPIHVDYDNKLVIQMPPSYRWMGTVSFEAFEAQYSNPVIIQPNTNSNDDGDGHKRSISAAQDNFITALEASPIVQVEPQLRDFKKETKTLVPSVIVKRKLEIENYSVDESHAQKVNKTEEAASQDGDVDDSIDEELESLRRERDQIPFLLSHQEENNQQKQSKEDELYKQLLQEIE
jgi:hypothetical protein